MQSCYYYPFLGEGQFGVVYTAVNVNTGEMMAMKEVHSYNYYHLTMNPHRQVMLYMSFVIQIRFQPNDIQAIKCVADELKTFEGIVHPNLVKYYGIELHKVMKHSDSTHSISYVVLSMFMVFMFSG